MRRLIAAVLCIAAAPMAMARSPIEAKLVIPSTKILPGVPFEMSIEVYNSSASTVRVATCDTMRHPPIDGQVNYECNRACMEWFEDHWRRSKHQPPDASAIVKPGERQILVLPVRVGLTGPDVEEDIGLSKLAGHKCAISLQLCVQDGPPIVTNEVVVEFVEPTGVDAQVWKRMNELTDGTWTTRSAGQGSSHALWEEVISKYSGSNYMPYAVLAMINRYDQATLDRINDAMQRFPDTPVIELLRTQAQITTREINRPND